jgi:FMN reductase
MYPIQGCCSSAGNASMSSQTVPAPPNPLWLIPSPINAQRRETTNTLSTAHATAIEQADGLIIATPIFKASYSGLLKVFLDLLPQFALAGKAILPIATGGSAGHLLALDYGLRPVLQSMGARHIVQSLFVPEIEMRVVDDKLTLGEQTEIILREAAYHFKCAVDATTDDKFLGHPRPLRLA